MKEIKKTLEQIHSYLAGSQEIDPVLKQKIRELDENIRKAIETNKNNSSELVKLKNETKELATRFEVEHPHIEGLLVQLMGILEGMGI